MNARVAAAFALASALVTTRARADETPPPLPPPEASPGGAPVPSAPAPSPAPPGVVVEPSDAPPPYARPAPEPYERTVPPYEWLANPQARRSAVGLDLGLWSAKRVGSGMPVTIFISGALGSAASLELRVPMAFVFDAGSSDRSGAAVGNTTMTLLYAPTSGGLTWFFGGRLAAPVASVSQRTMYETALVYAYAANAFYDMHLWVQNHVPIGLRAGIEYQAHGNFFLRASFDPTLLLPFGRASGRSVAFFHQMRLEVEGRSDEGVGAGLALQYVHLPTEKNGFGPGDNVQTAMEPYFVFETKRRFFMRAGLLVGLDTPLGFGFEEGRVTTFRLSIGSQL
ncbi:MAG: hypothetical protein JST00_16180 [Deltaproteobacteria bacterium]|nr:hypothetical protein [Deltaproteobacteria bacterium]